MALIQQIDQLRVEVHPDRDEMGRASALAAADILREAIAARGEARIVLASAASQSDFLRHLRREEGIDWSRVVAFHQDEWVGVPMEQPYSFAGYIKEHLFDAVRPGQTHYLDGTAADVEAECERYGALLCEKPLDLIMLGIGENGHLAFNEPHEADFADPKIMKIITLDERCRRQQKNDFGFERIEDVPTQGITITMPVIMGARRALTVAPTTRKAEAVARALTGPISEQCPASALRRMEGAVLYLDPDSAAGLPLLTEA